MPRLYRDAIVPTKAVRSARSRVDLVDSSGRAREHRDRGDPEASNAPHGPVGGASPYGGVGYSDPFGLCPIGDPECAALETAYGTTGAVVGAWLGGGTGAMEALATGGVLTPAAIAQTAAGSAAGAAIGGLLANVVYFAKSATSGESAGARTGRARHAEYSEQMKARGYNTNTRLPGSRLRPDAWSGEQGIVRELKPNTPTGRAQGVRQLARYKQAAEEAWGKTVKAILDLY